MSARMGGVARAAAAALVVVVVGLASSVATAQMESCNAELPPVLVANYSGLACQPVWNNFVLRVRTPKRLADASLPFVRKHVSSYSGGDSASFFSVAVTFGYLFEGWCCSVSMVVWIWFGC